MPPNIRMALVLAALISTTMGQFIVFSIMAPLIRNVNLAEYQGGIILSASALVYALSSGVWGRLSDRLGRRQVMLIGLLGYSGGTLIFAASFELGHLGWVQGQGLFWLLVVTRMLQAILMGATVPACIAYIADITQPSERVKGMGLVGSANGLGSLLGPLVAAPLLMLHLIAPLLAGSVVTGVTAWVLWRFLPPSPQQISTTPIQLQKEITATVKSYFDPRYAHLLLIGVLIFLAYAMCQQTIGYFIQDRLQLTPDQSAPILALSFIFSAAGALLSMLLLVTVLKLPPFTLLIIGLPCMGLGFAIASQMTVAAESHLAMGLVGLGLGMAMPGFSAAASLSVAAQEQGSVSGSIAGAPALGFILGPTIGTLLYPWHNDLPFLASAVLSAALLIAVLWLRYQTRKRQPSER